MDDEAPDDVMHSVCQPELPDAGEVWGVVVEDVDQWIDTEFLTLPNSRIRPPTHPLTDLDLYIQCTYD
jgi:hypothetical protein